jgi:hypothetical protein
VLECYKQQAAAAKQGGVGAAPDSQSQESYEFAIVSLIRAFSGMQAQFAGYLQAAPAGRAAAAAAGFSELTGSLLPDAIAGLSKQYNSSAAYSGDSLLQARALLADAQWFASEAAAVGAATGQPGAAFEGLSGYAAGMVRHLLRWLFSEQFGGPRAYLPAAPTTTPAGIAAGQALGTLGAAALPSAGVPLSDVRWLQARAMGTHALLATAYEAAAITPAAAANVSRTTSVVVSAMAGAHIADFWGARVGAARASGDADMRALALDDRIGARGARDAALGLATALAALRAQVPAASALSAAKMRDGLAQMLGGLALSANDELAEGAPAAAVSAAARASGLADALLNCFGAGAAGKGDAHAAGCAALTAATGDLVKAALGADLGGSGDPLYAAATADVALQWRCAVRSPSACTSAPGCARALLPAPPTPGGYPLIAPLPLPGEVPACQADDGRLGLRNGDNATKAALASSPACASFLQLPSCETLSGGATGCGRVAACRWQPRGTRNLVEAPAAAANAAGVCATYWPSLIADVTTPKLRAALASASSACELQKAADGCGSLLAEVAALRGGRGGGGATAKIVAPAVAAGAAVLLAAGGYAAYARRRAAAAAAAGGGSDESSGGLPSSSLGSGLGSGSSKKRKGGKKRVWKRKIKRAEPGEYKPDLMRDSFTDYLARPAFRTGVAIASANMAAGGPVGAGGADFENPLAALRDEVGGHPKLLLEPTQAFISGARRLGDEIDQQRAAAAGGGSGGGGSGGGSPQRARARYGDAGASTSAGLGASEPGSLIDLGGSGGGDDDASELGLASRRAPGAGASPPRVPLPPGSAMGSAMGSESGFGFGFGGQAASAAGFSHNPFQPGAAPSEAGSAYSAGRSSLGAGRGGGASAAGGPRLGSRLGRLRTRPVGAGSGGGGGAYGASGGDDGEGSQGGTPTSSCCHDSVCTFRLAPGAAPSVAGSVAGSVMGASMMGGGPGSVFGGSVMGGSVMGGSVMGGSVMGGSVMGGSVMGGARARARRSADGASAAAALAARRQRGLEISPEEDEEAAPAVCLSRTSWASQEMLVSVPSSAPLSPTRRA